MTSARRKGRSVIERLNPGEAARLLRALLARHPELLPEAEKIAGASLAAVDIGTVAADVESDVTALEADVFNARAGGHRGGYTDPSDAAWEILEEAVEPYISEMKRLMELGMADAAAKACRGIILGLYRARGKDPTGVLGWAEDFPKATALVVARAFFEGMRERKGKGPLLPEDFPGFRVPEWEEALAKAMGRRARIRRRG